MSYTYVISTSPHGQPCIQLGRDVPKEYHQFLRHCVQDNWMDSPAYNARRPANPFLQGRADRVMRNGHEAESHTENGLPTWTLVEFWGDDSESFVSWLNNSVTSQSTYFQNTIRFYRGMI